MRELDPFDIRVGKTIRAYRHLNGLTQQQLGQAIEVTFQQVQKYELGKNRVSVATFQKIRELLKIPLEAVFEHSASELHLSSVDPLDTKLLLRILSIQDSAIKKRIIDLITITAHEER